MLGSEFLIIIAPQAPFLPLFWCASESNSFWCGLFKCKWDPARSPVCRGDTRFNSTPFGHFCSLIAEIRCCRCWYCTWVALFANFVVQETVQWQIKILELLNSWKLFSAVPEPWTWKSFNTWRHCLAHPIISALADLFDVNNQIRIHVDRDWLSMIT